MGGDEGEVESGGEGACYAVRFFEVGVGVAVGVLYGEV